MEIADKEQLSAILEQQLQLIERGQKSPKEALWELAKTGLFMFHGSQSEEIEEIEPRTSDYTGELDKKEQIYSTNNPDIAAIFAIISKYGSNFGWHADQETNEYFYYASEEIIDSLEADKESAGTIYILDKKPFQRRGYKKLGFQFTATEPVKPLGKIKVSKDDLIDTDAIGIIDEKTKDYIKPGKGIDYTELVNL